MKREKKRIKKEKNTVIRKIRVDWPAQYLQVEA